MKFSKFIVAVFFITLFVFNNFGQSLSKTEADKIYQLLENSDSRGTFEYLADLFERNGASVFIGAKEYPALQLQLKDLTEVINDYDSMYKTISVSRMPKLEESKIYWENWSKVLAKDNFKQDKFFRDDRERFLLANYNSLLALLLRRTPTLTKICFTVQTMLHWLNWVFLHIPSAPAKWIRKNSIIPKRMK